MSDNGDIEANFFDQPRQHGVRRDTLVQELSAEDLEAAQRLKGDTCINLFYESMLGGCTLAVIM